MSRVRPNDRVRITSKEAGDVFGATGVVSKVDVDNGWCVVEFDGTTERWWMLCNWLEVIDAEKNRIALAADAPEMLQLLQELWDHGMPYNNGDACDATAMWDRVFAMLQKHKEHLK